MLPSDPINYIMLSSIMAGEALDKYTEDLKKAGRNWSKRIVAKHRYERAREAEAQKAEEESIRDPLTDLPNSRALKRAFAWETSRAQRYSRPLAALFLDIDGFKKYNDEFLHINGNKVLVALAKTMKRQTRNIDIPGRFGGEEFMILLPETDLQKALEVAERVRLATVSDLSVGRPVGNGNEKVLRDITVSVGVAQWQKGQSFDDFVDLADQAMYYAKKQGRNRVAGINNSREMIQFGVGWSQQ